MVIHPYSRFLFIPFRRRGKDFVTLPGSKKWKKNENTNSTSPRVRLFQDISNPLFKDLILQCLQASVKLTNTFAVESLYSCSNVL